MSKSTLNRMFLSLFYQLSKDYGLMISYTKPGKGDIDSDTGVRSTVADKTYTILAVETPVDHQGSFILKLLGKTDKPRTIFLIRTRDLPVKPEIDDYFTSRGIKYKVMDLSTSGDVVVELSGESFT